MPSEQSHYKEIGAFEAKTKLSEILRKVDQGESFTITVRGRAMANIVPIRVNDRHRVTEAIRQILAMPKITGISDETIREWIAEGRE